MEELRIVLLGRTAAGRSSVGNTILGEKVFKAECSVNSVTKICQRAERVINGRRIVVIDTPGFFDTDRSEKEIKEELIYSLVECAPGPHVFILVLKVDRYTEENQKTLQKLLEYFTDSILPRMILLFTHGEDLKENMTIIDFINQSDDKKNNSGKYSLKDLAEKCGNRVHVVDNKHWNENSSYSHILERLKQLNLPEQTIRDIADKIKSTPADETPWFNILAEQCDTAEPERKDERDEQYKKEYRSNRFQLTQLMKNTQILCKSNGQHYSNETLEEIGKAINEEEIILQEMTGAESKTVDMEEIRRRARERVRNKVQRQVAGVAVGTLLGALLGVGVGAVVPFVLVAGAIRALFHQPPQATGPPVQKADVGAGAFAGAGGIFLYGAGKGGASGYEVAKTADNPKEAADKAAKASVQNAGDVLKTCWNLGKTETASEYDTLNKNN
uniref:AIG1-type G domain-containing protein n=1 Tax=Astyanax mexicanus TaxID=7994 RepID=A0A8B9HUP8_ASTMX